MRFATQLALCQVRATLALMLQTLTQGMAEGWSSPGPKKLSAGEGPFLPDTNQVSWIVSLFQLGALCGAVLGFLVFPHMGRRPALFVAPCTFALWVALTYGATSAPYLYAARWLAGVGMGINFTFTSIYVAEVATPAVRAALVLVTILLVPLGMLLSFVAGPYVSYWQLALVPAPLIVLAVFFTAVWTPESPYYLTALGRHEDAMAALLRLRRGLPVEEVRHEAGEIQRSVRRQLEQAATWRQTFSPPGTRRAALVVLVLSGSPALLGVGTVLSYTQLIFKEAGTPLSKSLSSMIVIGVKMVMSVVAMQLIERLGRRLQLGIATVTCGLAMSALAGYFLAKEYLGASLEGVTWLPLIALAAFMAATGGGVIPVLHVLMGELLSQRAKKVVAPLAAVTLFGTSFVISKEYLPLGHSVGFCVPFGVFALTNFGIMFFALYFVPETRGKTLVQLQDELSGQSCSDSDDEPPIIDKIVLA